MESLVKPKKQHVFTKQKSVRSISPRTVVTNFTNRFNDQKKRDMLLSLYKQNKQRKLGIVTDKKTKYETVDDRVILYRFLGHLEIPNAHVWKIDTSCWV